MHRHELHEHEFCRGFVGASMISMPLRSMELLTSMKASAQSTSKLTILTETGVPAGGSTSRRTKRLELSLKLRLGYVLLLYCFSEACLDGLSLTNSPPPCEGSFAQKFRRAGSSRLNLSALKPEMQNSNSTVGTYVERLLAEKSNWQLGSSACGASSIQRLRTPESI